MDRGRRITIIGPQKEVFFTSSPEETVALGRALARRLTAPAVVCLYGDLGAGKTTFVKGMVEGVTGDDDVVVQSPTFTYLQVYKGLYHFDLYRLKGEEAFLSMGFDEYFEGDGICCIEWPERIASLLPSEKVSVYVE